MKNKNILGIILIIILVIILLVMSISGYFLIYKKSSSNKSVSNNQNKVSGQIGSWSLGGTDSNSIEGNDYDYDASLYIKDSSISKDDSNFSRIKEGEYDNSKAIDLKIEDTTSGHNGILILNSNYYIKNASIKLLTDATGTNTCDFSGKGSTISVFGSSNVKVEDSSIETKGVATMPIFVDDGAILTLKNSSIKSNGGTLYKDYLNTPEQTLMVAPPWILGIMGTSRGANVMGDNTVLNVVDSNVEASAWAALSTDAGNNMALNVYNSKISLTNKDESSTKLQEDGGQISESLDNPYTTNYGSGYGTYVIGDVNEIFRGTTFNVGTYATIFTGGSATYSALIKDKTYKLTDSSNNSTYEYTADKSKRTKIYSDTFGFMAHQSKNKITLEKKTLVESKYATFLIKSGSSNEEVEVNIDNSEIKNGGVLIQVMDNDDATNGGMMSENDELNTNKRSQNFIPYHEEASGFNLDSSKNDGTNQTFNFLNGIYNGNIYNASGSNGLNATTLNINLKEDCTLNSAISKTSAIHINYDGDQELNKNNQLAFSNKDEADNFAKTYQNTKFTINEYFYIGHVANYIHNNNGNDINVSLEENSIWNVTNTSLISSLTIKDNAKVIVPENVVLTVNNKTYTNQTIESSDLD